MEENPLTSNNYSESIFQTNSTPTLQDLVTPSANNPVIRSVIIILLAIAFLITSVGGNALVILAYIIDKNVRQSPSNAYLAALALVDMGVGLTAILFGFISIYSQAWQFGREGCQLWIIFSYGLTCVSSTHLVLIALDRYRILFYGLNYLSSRTLWNVGKEVGFCWALGGWILLPILLDWDNIAVEPSAKKYCYAKKSLNWVLLSTIVSFIAPGCVMAKLYHKIFLELRRRLRKKAGGFTPSPLPSSAYYSDGGPGQGGGQGSGQSQGQNEPIPRSQNTLSVQECDSDNLSMDVGEVVRRKKEKLSLDQERRALITLGVLIGAFFICWGPYTVACFVQAIGPKVPIPKLLYSMFGLLGWINSCVNPIVYTIRNSDFRKAFKKILNCCKNA